MPRFSIIIPVYNVESYLRECLDSVLGQTFTDWEAICVNDGSTDGSAAILDDYARRDKRFLIIAQPNGGLSAARNTGLAAATGEYMLFLDSDDWVEPTMLKQLAHHCNSTDMLCFACRRTDNGASDPLQTEQAAGWDYYNRHALERREVAFVCVWQRCYRRSFLIENNLCFREGILHEDNEFTPRACLKAKKVTVIPDVLYNYRVRPGSIMTTRGMKSKESLILIGNDLSEMFGQETSINKTIVYRALTQCYQMAFIDNSKEEDRHLRRLIDWRCYRRVSRTKLRHRMNYTALKISPILFREIGHIVDS